MNIISWLLQGQVMWLAGENLTSTESSGIIKILVNLAWIFNYSCILLAILNEYRESSHYGIQTNVSLSTRICSWREACLICYNLLKMSVSQEKLLLLSKYQGFSMVFPYVHMQDPHIILTHLSSRNMRDWFLKV